jgi:uncharacterized protein YqgC (DUF456 family)
MKKLNHGLVKERIELAAALVSLVTEIVLLVTALIGLFNMAYNYLSNLWNLKKNAGSVNLN